MMMMMSPLPLPTAPEIPITAILQAIDKRHAHTGDQARTEHRGPPLVVVTDGAALLDAGDAPEVDAHAVEQGDDGEDGEADGRGQADEVAKVEQRGGDGAEDDGEFELCEEEKKTKKLVGVIFEGLARR
jgi:hypothetical protein